MQTLLIIDMKRRRSSTNTADHGPPSLKPVPNPLLGSSNNGADHGPASQSHIESSLPKVHPPRRLQTLKRNSRQGRSIATRRNTVSHPRRYLVKIKIRKG